MRRLKFAVVVGVALGLASLTSCTNDDATEPTGTPSVSSGPSDHAATDAADPSAAAAELESTVMAGRTADDVVASGTGELEAVDGELLSVTVDVHEVRAGTGSTVVELTVRSGGESFSLDSLALTDRAGSLYGVAVIDPAADERYAAFEDAGDTYYSTCSYKPKTLSSDPYPLTCLVAPLQGEPDTVSLQLPDLPLIDDVPVVRVGE